MGSRQLARVSRADHEGEIFCQDILAGTAACVAKMAEMHCTAGEGT